LHSDKVFSVSHAALPAGRLVMGERLGGDTAQRADPKGMFPTMQHGAQQQNCVCGEVLPRAAVE